MSDLLTQKLLSKSLIAILVLLGRHEKLTSVEENVLGVNQFVSGLGDLNQGDQT